MCFRGRRTLKLRYRKPGGEFVRGPELNVVGKISISLEHFFLGIVKVYMK